MRVFLRVALFSVLVAVAALPVATITFAASKQPREAKEPKEIDDVDPRRAGWDAQDSLDRYLYLWRNERFDEMYDLAASTLKEKKSRESFVGTLDAAKKDGVRLEEYAVGEIPQSKRAAARFSIPVRMVFRHAGQGPGADATVKISKSIAMVKEGDGWRVSGSVTGSVSGPKKSGKKKNSAGNSSGGSIEGLIP